MGGRSGLLRMVRMWVMRWERRWRGEAGIMMLCLLISFYGEEGWVGRGSGMGVERRWGEGGKEGDAL